MESLDFGIYNILILFGSFQGFLLCLLLSTSKKFRKKSNIYLALLLFTLSLLNLVGALESIGFVSRYSVVGLMPIHWLQLIPVSIYFFVIYLIRPDHEFKKWEYLLFLPFIFETLFRGSNLIQLYSGSLLQEEFDVVYWVCNVFEIFAILFTIGVVIYSIRQIDHYHKILLERFSEYEDISLRWLKTTLLCGGLLSILWAIVAYNDFEPGEWNKPLTRALWLGISINIYWIGYSMFFRRELFEVDLAKELSNGIDKKPVELSSKTEEHYEGLLKLMKEEKLYQNPDLSMSILSELTDLSNGYLSQIINQKEGKHFFDFVNKYRVKEVQKNLDDPKFDHYSILGIALKAGFKSKSTFNAVFKKMTGETPSKYKNRLESL